MPVIDAGQVKNKSAAPVQISAEQLLREATERLGGEGETKRKAFVDGGNSYEHKQQQRTKFEDGIRRNRERIGNWVQYARFEEGLGEWARARSVYERSLDVEPRNAQLWLKYAEMEMKQGNVNLARNVWDRAVTILPRVDQFWYKYAYMEERLGNTAGAREVFERWMRWEPEEEIWVTFAKFERRMKDWPRVRGVFERMLVVHPRASAWTRYARWEEEEPRDVARARAVWERAVDALAAAEREPALFIEFARFEVRQQETERARAVYRYALGLFAKSAAEGLYHSYAQFEKQHGTPETIQDVVLTRRRAAYEAQLAAAPYDYDGWLAYLRMEETEGGDADVVRDVYERAIAQVPPVPEKRHWRRYIYLWLYYAAYEELAAKDADRAEAVLRACLALLPHERFTFAKVWLALAQLLVRGHRLAPARRLLGQALGRCPKARLFAGYIALELQLREFDRCRTLYERFLEWAPARAATWIRYAELEALLGDDERARGIYELAIGADDGGAVIALDMPELVWKAYIDYEFEEGRLDAARALYERLLLRSDHIKVWVSYATFEASAGDMSRCRAVLQRASELFRASKLTAERLLLMEAWRELEVQHGSDESRAALGSRLPKRVLKRRKGPGGWEEYHDYAFPDDQAEASGHLRLLELARQWKRQQQTEPNP